MDGTGSGAQLPRWRTGICYPSNCYPGAFITSLGSMRVAAGPFAFGGTRVYRDSQATGD